MTFKTKSRVLEASTQAKLRELVDVSFAKRERFTLEKAPGHSLSVTAYNDEGLVLELHRGKKWEGWLSVPIKTDETRAILTDYYNAPVVASGAIERRGEWLEVAAAHPAVYVAIFVAVIALIVWATFFRH